MDARAVRRLALVVLGPLAACAPVIRPPPSPVVAEEDAAAAAPEDVDVHFSAEIVTPCPFGRVNRRSIGEAGDFAFEPELERSASDTPAGGWVPVCRAPCTAWLDPAMPLRVRGAGLPDSAPFLLPRGHRHLALASSSTGTAAKYFGWAFLGAGTLFLAGGATMFVLAARNGTATPNDLVKTRGEEVGASLFALASLAFYIPALVVLLSQGTTVTTDAGPLPRVRLPRQ
jgi:hypothetical protein